MKVSGVVAPQFTTPEGSLLSTQDSLWIELQIQYSNPYSSNAILIELMEGTLPPGLEIDETGLIRGYPNPPVVTNTLNEVTTNATITESGTNLITCASTTKFSVGRPIVFTGTTLGGIVSGTTYYVKTINNTTTFTISITPGGTVFPLSSGSGSMFVTLPATSVGAPAIRTYSFTLKLISDLGNATASYSITVINQNVPVSEGGPGKSANTRIPTILNTRPLAFNVNDSDPYYGYYILPPISPTLSASINTTVQSGDYFSFKIIGHDFDGSVLSYSYSGLPLGLVGDTNTGWITGTPTIAPGISQYNFSVNVSKLSNPSLGSVYFNFAMRVSNGIVENITWVTPGDLGTIFNGTISTLNVLATSDVPLLYRITSGSLPPNLTLLTNGEITGYVADQPTEDFLIKGDSTEFSFTIQAYSTAYSIIHSSKTFTITVLQEYSQPTDILYIKASPSVPDRNIIDSLLTSDTLIPSDYLYRPDDVYFGKASSVIYVHAYGIYASDIEEYIAAVNTNHYDRNITLGELKTAVAKNDVGEIVYEVVYSEVIDNLVNPAGVSVSSSIYWPVPIDLSLGPWYTSITDIYTSYDFDSTYFTSLTPGYARILYPNSLYNMRNKVAATLGQEYDSRLLPLWMTSQQENGSTLGYTQAWVICYTLPGKAETIKNNINTLWKAPDGTQYVLNQINFSFDRFTVDKSSTYNYDKNMNPAAWTGLPSATPVPDPLNSKDFTILFPRRTILPDETQY